jgi:hypothetical protein
VFGRSVPELAVPKLLSMPLPIAIPVVRKNATDPAGGVPSATHATRKPQLLSASGTRAGSWV